MLLVNKITFSYNKKETFSSLSFEVKKGTNLAVIGESGCGKSTLLKLIYGLYDLDEGSIYWNGEQVLGPKFNLVSDIASMKYLAQDFDLMPFITVEENIGKHLSNFFPEKKKKRIAALLEVVEMKDFATIKAKHLSGGQMQRVALAKVLAKEPELLLLDEPFSHIDNFRKNSLRRKIFSYLKQKNITCIIATHDLHDILSFTNEVLVLQNGKKINFGATENLYYNPKSYYTASLFGEVNVIKINGISQFIYSHQIIISNDNPDFQVQVQHVFFRGSHYLIIADKEGSTVYFEHFEKLSIGAFVGIKIQKSGLFS